MAKKRQKFKKYRCELEKEVIRLYLDEHLPKKGIASLLVLSMKQSFNPS
ncbi:MAG: hypothetical protein ACUVQF_07255 [Fervidobacterium sp.]